MSQELSDEQIGQVSDALAAGRKVEAIKLYREFTGLGLLEAKEFIDELIPKLKEQDPVKYAGLSDKSAGCAWVMLVCLGFAATAFWVMA